MPQIRLLLPQSRLCRHPLRLPVAAAVVLGLALVGWWAMHYKHEIDLRRRLEAKVQAALVEADTAARAARAQALAAGEKVAAAQLAASRTGADAAVARLTSFTGCFRLVWLMLRDTCTRGRNAYTDTHIRAVVDAEMMSPFQEGCRDLKSCLDDLQERLTGSNVRLAADLATAVEPERSELRAVLERQLAELTGGVQTQAPKVRAIATGTVLASVGLAISAACVRATWAAARNVFGAIARRMAVTTGAALGTAAIDGPFPVGDCIAVVIEVGGTVWCLYDLVRARFTLRDELAGTLHQQVRESCAAAQTSFRAEADALLAAAIQQNRQLANAAVAAIRQ